MTKKLVMLCVGGQIRTLADELQGADVPVGEAGDVGRATLLIDLGPDQPRGDAATGQRRC